jgi:hypothetical protein
MMDLLDLVSQYADPIGGRGKEVLFSCPLHEEKTPSFFVNPEKNVWHCFGCGEGGDDVVFYMWAEGVSQAHALHKLRAPLSEAEVREARTEAAARQDKKREFKRWTVEENTKLCREFRDLEDQRDDALLACKMIRAHPFWFSYVEREQYLDRLAQCYHKLTTLTWWLDILTYDKHMNYRQLLYKE